jgi:hypothetical protein
MTTLPAVRSEQDALALLEQGRQLIALARSAGEVKQLRDQAAAVAHYMRQQRFAFDAIQDAAELKLRAERRLGEMLAGRERNRGGNPNLLHDATGCPPTYGEMGIERTQAHRWQQIAALPEGDFERHIAESRAAGGELSTEGVVRLAAAARRRQQAAPPAVPVPVVTGEGPVDAVLAGSASCSFAAADAMDFLAGLPADSLDLVFFSPPYEDRRSYGGLPPLVGEAWVARYVEVIKAALRACKGVVCCVCDGKTENYRWSAVSAKLIADLDRAGVHLRKPPAYVKNGTPGSGGPDWWRDDYEIVVCATRGGKLPWSDNTATGHEPVYRPGGDPSHRRKDDSRVNGRAYVPPDVANPGNLVRCVVGGGRMGDDKAHQGEAAFPEALVEPFVLSFCPPGGVVCDMYLGTGTTAAVTLRHGRRFVGCDIRPSQVELARRRIAGGLAGPDVVVPGGEGA